jgi:hypothetical protein
MNRSRIVSAIGVVCVLIGLLISQSKNEREEIVVDEDMATTAVAMLSPTPTTGTTLRMTMTREATTTATATPVPTPVLVGQLVLKDSFDDTTSGWEPMYVPAQGSDALVNKNAFNGYVNGQYSFVVNYRIDDRFPMLWDFNTTKSLPNYPYAVEADVNATRDHLGVVILDYRGDVSNINNGDGIFVRFRLGEAPSTPRQAWTLLGEDTGNDRPFTELNVPFPASVYALEIFETSAGQLYRLACDQFVAPLLTRNATIRMEVDASIVHAIMTDTTNPMNTATITCKRVATPPTTPAIMGIAAIDTPRIVPVQSDHSLDFSEIRVLAVEAIKSPIPPMTIKQEYLRDSNCDTEFNMDIRKRLSSYTNDSTFCGALGDWGVFDIPIIRYSQRADQLMGRWQCGSDPEGVIELYKQDWRTMIRFVDQDVATLYAVDNSEVGGGLPHLVLWDNSTLQPGDRMTSLSDFFLAYNDTNLVASWAGMCTRIP